MSDIRTLLRDATAGEHRRVDRLFSTFDLARRDEYRAFLEAQAAAFLPVEAALDRAGAAAIVPDWPRRRRGALIEADLALLGATPPLSPSPALSPSPVGSLPELSGAPAVLGTVYVLEGSRLGGALLKRRLPPDFPSSFLTAPQAPGSWRALLDLLDASLRTPEAVAAAIAAAKQVFARFESSARQRACAA